MEIGKAKLRLTAPFAKELRAGRRRGRREAPETDGLHHAKEFCRAMACHAPTKATATGD